MVEDPKWELAILATVQGCYEKLLQPYAKGEVPVPAGLEDISLQGEDEVLETLILMHRWLSLLELAVTPAMLRRAFTVDTDPEIAEALLRYYTRSRDSSDQHRDKTDLIVTFLYRYPRVPGQWERRGYGLDGALPLSPFEIALMEILSDTEGPPLPERQVHLLRQFDRWHQEAQRFQDLNAMLQSQIIPRVRAFKRSLGASFYHPAVLAAIAPYNAAFGNIFDRLFLKATAQIKKLADEVKELGGSILGTLDGVDVTVEEVDELQESELLRADYAVAHERFQRISKLRKSLEQRPPMRRPGGSSTAKPRTARPSLDVAALRSTVTPKQISTEEAKLLRVEESIRVFVRVADPKFRHVVPMRFFNLILTPAEADAFSADYLEEKSVRAEVARAQLRMVALLARMKTELGELKRTALTPSLWQLHADALLSLLAIEDRVTDTAARITVPGDILGIDEVEEEALQASLQKLKACAALVVEALSGESSEKAATAGSAQP